MSTSNIYDILLGYIEGLEICQDLHSSYHVLNLGKSMTKSLQKQLCIFAQYKIPLSSTLILLVIIMH